MGNFGCGSCLGYQDERFTLKCPKTGASAVVSSFGATLVFLNIPDHKGNLVDCVLGFDNW